MAGLNCSDLGRIFTTLDDDDDGVVSVKEVSFMLAKMGVSASPDELQGAIGESKLDLQGFIAFYESTLEATAGEHKAENELLLEAFKVFDQNDDGYITSGELLNVLSNLGLWEETNGGDCSRMIGRFDTNSDGRLDFQEFKNMMLSSIA